MTQQETKKLQKMEDALNELDEKVDLRLNQLDGKVDRVLVALVGDDLQLDKGLIKSHKEMDARITRLESIWNKVIWVSLGAGIAAGLSINKIIEWIQEAASKAP